MEIQGYNLPDDLHYEENHFWVKEDGDLLVMGLDDFGQQMAGEIVYIQLPAEGKRLKVGKSFAKMESGKLQQIMHTTDDAALWSGRTAQRPWAGHPWAIIAGQVTAGKSVGHDIDGMNESPLQS